MSEIIRKGKNVLKNAPRISVIIPAYNVAEYINETLESVFAQTYKNFETIVINDGSPDTETFEKIIKNYFDKIIYIKQKNAGAAVARNTGIENARGEIIAFLDGDDVWFDDSLEEQIKVLDEKNLGMIYCDALLFGDHSGKFKTYMQQSVSKSEVKPETLLDGSCNVITSGTIVKKEHLLNAGLFNPKAIRTEDFEMWFSFGVAMSAFYYLSREAEKRAAAIFNILLFHFLTGGLAFFALFFFPHILGNLFQSAEMTKLAPAIGVVIWIWIFSMFLETVAIANQESILATVFIIFAQFSKTALMICAVVFFDSVEAIIYAAIVQGTIQTVILLIYLNSRFPRFWTTFSFKFLREHLAYALPFGFAGILWVMQNDIHTYFVGYRFSDAEFAIYAYGCFQVPLIMMLAESVTSVLIPRMSALQLADDRREMIRLTARAMQKLSFFYFPIFVFLMITANTFVITLFTRNYAASAEIFKINLLLLPFHILVSDPIVRSYKEFGKFLVALRICMFAVLFSALYFNINRLDLTGIIAIAVASKIVEGLIAETVVFYKIGAKFSDFYLLKDIGKTAIIS